MSIEKYNFEVYEARFNIVEERVKELKKRVETFDNIKEVLVELKILTTQQIEANAQRDEMLQEHGIALAKAVETLKDLSKKQDKHEDRLEDLDRKLTENKNDGNISINNLIKKILYVGIGIATSIIFTGIVK